MTALKYRNLPVKQKLCLIIMLTVCTALTLACGAILIFERFELRDLMRNDLGVLAEIYSANSTAALTFDDPQAARELLFGLKAKLSINFAAISPPSHKPLAVYRRDNDPRAIESPLLEGDASWFE